MICMSVVIIYKRLVANFAIVICFRVVFIIIQIFPFARNSGKLSCLFGARLMITSPLSEGEYW